jgi:hypothetical protein
MSLTSLILKRQQTAVKDTASVSDSKEASSTVFDDTKSLSDYVLVKKGALLKTENGDVKPLPAVPSIEKPSLGTVSSSVDNITLKNVLRNNRSIKGKRLSPLDIQLWMTGGSTSSSGTAQAPVQRIRPSDSAEFSSLAALYDEYKCHGGEFIFRISTAAGVVGATNGGAAYDPVSDGVYGALVTLLAASQKMAPVSGPSGGASFPGGVTKTGFWHFKFKCPNGVQGVPQSASPVSNNVTGMWVDVNQTIADYGYIKSYVNAAAGTTSAIEWYLRMDCTFRSRS